MIVLLEGPDCAGKTTLLNEVFMYNENVHYGVFPTPIEAFQEYERLLNTRDALGPKIDIVIDRMHISERIYGRIYHNKWMSNSHFSYLEDKLSYLKTIVVVCLPPLQLCLALWRKRKDTGAELLTDEQHFIDIYCQYQELYQISKLPVVTYDWTNEAYNERVSIVERINAKYSSIK